MTAYYNEIDPGAAAWLRELIAEGLIAPGDVDERSIADVQPSDLKGYVQVHLFAGIGGWSLALRLGGWPDDEPVWTGSCPCQPFSAAGKRRGTDDERHLWPEFRRLIAECRPPVTFGEQVASAAGRAWLASVRADLEALGHAVGAADLCSAGVGAPNIRQRLWWVAYAVRQPRERLSGSIPGAEAAVCGARLQDGRVADGPWGGGATRLLADPSSPRLEVVGEQHARAERQAAERGGEAGGVGDSDLQRQGSARDQARAGNVGGTGSGFWSAVEWIPCRDGKARPTKPGTFPLAHGVPGRVGLLRGYGNAINPYVAAEFIAAFRDVRAAA